MNLDFQDLIPGNFNDNSHVWVYQSNRAFTASEAAVIQPLLQKFAKGGKSHGTHVKGYANLFFEHFIVLIADEVRTGVGSFSSHSAMRLIKNIGRDFQVELFDRLMLAFIIQERIQLIPLSGLNSSIEKNFITPDTLYFNNTILTKKEFLNNWIIPVKDSWLARRTVINNDAEEE